MSKHRLTQIKGYRLAQIFTLATCYFLLATCCLAKPISSTDLIAHTKEYDGKIVSFQGEVIGDVMKRGDFCWVNINDGQSAIGIWATTDLTEDITFTGGYKSIGDIIEVKGRFNRACIEHGGDLDIHADSLKIIQTGYKKTEGISYQRYKTSFILLGVLICLGILGLLKKKPKQR